MVITIHIISYCVVFGVGYVICLTLSYIGGTFCIYLFLPPEKWFKGGRAKRCLRQVVLVTADSY